MSAYFCESNTTDRAIATITTLATMLEPPYEIKGNKIFFKHNTELTKKELIKLVEGL